MNSALYVPQRFLANNRNKVFDATLIASAVQGVMRTVVETPQRARQGTAELQMTGTYTGEDDATYDFQVVDTSATNKLVSNPVLVGSGSESMTSLAVTTASEQDFTVQCSDAGTPAQSAKVNIQGATVIARAPGTPGNDIKITVDESAIVFNEVFPSGVTFSLLADLKKGDGGDNSGIDSTALDFDTAVMGSDNLIPDTALRVAFEGDTNNIYLQYKVIDGSTAKYFFVPALQLDYPSGSKVFHVTGDRTITITNNPPGAITETLPGIITLYDFLEAIKTTSVLCDVDGVVAPDHSPDGEASLELNLRTIAHANPTSGSGSKAATGLIDVTVSPTAPTEMIIFHCQAIDATADPLGSASVGHELWGVYRGSYRPENQIGQVYTGELESNPDFTASVPQRLPFAGTTPQGDFNLSSVTCATRAATDPACPPMCVAGMALGPAAVNKTITLTYTRRPPPTCDCKDMPNPNLNGPCLGTDGGTGGDSVDYSTANRTRLIGLYQWYADTVRSNSTPASGDQAPMFSNPLGQNQFETSAESFVGSVEVDQAAVTVPPGPPPPGAGLGQNPGSVIPATYKNVPVGDTGPVMSTAGGLGSPLPFQYLGRVYTPFNPQPLKDIVGKFEKTLQSVNELGGNTLGLAGEDAWDIAVAEMEGDVVAQLTGSSTVSTSYTFNGVPFNITGQLVQASEAIAAGNLVTVWWNGSAMRVRKWVPGLTGVTGFVNASITVGSSGVVFVSGLNVAPAFDGAPPSAGVVVRASATAGDYSILVVGVSGTVSNTPGVSLTVVSSTEVSHDVTDYFALGLTAATAVSSGRNRLAALTDRYLARLNQVLITAGISPLGKADANNQESGDGCWKDYGGDLFWDVVGSDGVKYAPAWSNEPYWASKFYQSRGAIFSTHEFAFQINIQCVSDLREGDQIVLTIGNAGTLSTYAVDDELYLPIIAAQALKFLGGAVASLVQTWHVTGSVDGAFASYVFDPGAPTTYNSGGLQMLLVMGGVPPGVGDVFTFAVTGGHYQWRKNGGSWSSAAVIPAGPTAFDSGLSFEFIRGIAPSFVQNDEWSFLVKQQWAASHVRVPNREWWFPGTSTASLEAQFASAADVDAVALAMHTVPSGAVITIEGGAAIGTTDWTYTIPWQAGLIVFMLPVAQLAQAWVRWSFTSADGMSVGWFWAGLSMQTETSCDPQLKRNYKVERGTVGGLLQGGQFLGKAINASLSWQQGTMTEQDMTDVSALIDDSKANNDQPFIFVPQFERAQDSILARIVEDEIEMTDEFNYHPDASSKRLLSAKMTLQGVWQ